MKSCRSCISYVENKDDPEHSCRVESQAMKRVGRRTGSLVDALTVNYFQVLFDLFNASKESDDAAFYGQRCFFHVEESQVEKVV